MNFLVVVLCLAGVALLSWVAWISLQSILQARVLLRARATSARLPDRPGRAAVRGRVRVFAPVRRPDAGAALWFHCAHQEYRRSGKRRSWRTVSEESERAVFTLESGGREFHVEGDPTKVQGTETRTVYDDEAALGLFRSSGDRRRVLRWLPVPEQLTVLGRLEARGGDPILVKDNKVGLLLTPHEPGHAAAIEIAKGVAGLVAVTAALALALGWYFSQGPRP